MVCILVKAEAESETLEGSEEEDNSAVKSLEEIQREKALNSLRNNLSKQIEEMNEDVEEEEVQEKPPVKKLRTKRSPKQEQVIYRPPAAKRKGMFINLLRGTGL